MTHRSKMKIVCYAIVRLLVKGTNWSLLGFSFRSRVGRWRIVERLPEIGGTQQRLTKSRQTKYILAKTLEWYFKAKYHLWIFIRVSTEMTTLYRVHSSDLFATVASYYVKVRNTNIFGRLRRHRTVWTYCIKMMGGNNLFNLFNFYVEPVKSKPI